MAQRTSQGLWMGVAPLPSGTAQPALPLAEALGRCNPDQPAPSPALAKEDVLYATRPKPPAQRIRATRSLDVVPGLVLVRPLLNKYRKKLRRCVGGVLSRNGAFRVVSRWRTYCLTE